MLNLQLTVLGSDTRAVRLVILFAESGIDMCYLSRLLNVAVLFVRLFAERDFAPRKVWSLYVFGLCWWCLG